ncbi:MAG: 30S ribosomal protein S9 [Candidatus Diapherotrites archaeon]|nr:30S ribosomal protein S9 [Candidatus Diapherotrites archaeon]
MAKKNKPKVKTVNAKAKKKRSVARATAVPGKGLIRINSRPIEIVEPFTLREMIKEPVYLAPEESAKLDIIVKVNGGGFMGQAVAVRGAIAKVIVAFTEDQKLREKFLEYDRMLLVDDARRVEPKKPLGRGARAKWQSSKR